MKTYGLCNHPSLLINPLTEIKEDICSVLETLDEPLCSSQILDDTEDLLACLNSQDLLDVEDDQDGCKESTVTEESASSSYPISLENSPYSVDEETLTCTDASITNQQSPCLSQSLSLNEDCTGRHTSITNNKNPSSPTLCSTRIGDDEDPSFTKEGITYEGASTNCSQNPSFQSSLIEGITLEDDNQSYQGPTSQSLLSTGESRTIDGDDSKTVGDVEHDTEESSSCMNDESAASSQTLLDGGSSTQHNEDTGSNFSSQTLSLLDIPSIQIEDYDDNGVVVENVFVSGIEQEINQLMEEDNESMQGIQTKLKKIMVRFYFYLYFGPNY